MNTLLKWIEWNECVFPINSKNQDIVRLMKSNPIEYFIVMEFLDDTGFFEPVLSVV